MLNLRFHAPISGLQYVQRLGEVGQSLKPSQGGQGEEKVG